MEQPIKDLKYYKRLPYSLIIEECTDEAVGKYYLASYGELAGCKTDGENEVEAVENLHELFDEYIQVKIENGSSIPEPAPVIIRAGTIPEQLMYKKIRAFVPDEKMDETIDIDELTQNIFEDSILYPESA